MRNLAILTMAAAALALAACGADGSSSSGDQNGEYRIDQSSGETNMTVETPDGDVTMRTGSDIPLDLPAGFTVVDGAEILGNTIINQADQKGALITFVSDKSPEEIADFYRAQAEAAGIPIQIETEINGGMMLGGESKALATTFSITAYPDEGGTTGQLTIGQDLN